RRDADRQRMALEHEHQETTEPDCDPSDVSAGRDAAFFSVFLTPFAGRLFRFLGFAHPGTSECNRWAQADADPRRRGGERIRHARGRSAWGRRAGAPTVTEGTAASS